jgi:hypothetical protein
MTRYRCIGQIALLVLLATAVRADQESRLHARLVGGEETPAINTPGHGRLMLKLSDNDTRIDFELSYQDLTGPALVAHVHVGQRGVAGGVSFFFCGGAKPACPAANSGTVTGTVLAADIVGPTGQGVAAGDFAGVVKMIRAGLAYGNVHTAAHPGGEIRGQLRGEDRDDD